MTEQIADAIEKALGKDTPVGVVISATHQCMSCRGVTKRNASFVTSALRGKMRHAEARSEFLRLVSWGEANR
jgi:GTP cyclohydrolase I